MSIRLVVTMGFGNGTFNGTISDVVTDGLTIGAAAEPPEIQRNPFAGPITEAFAKTTITDDVE